VSCLSRFRACLTGSARNTHDVRTGGGGALELAALASVLPFLPVPQWQVHTVVARRDATVGLAALTA
jgi:hypothetical protein